MALTVENSEIYFLDTLLSQRWTNYSNEPEREQARNIITYRLSNTTGKKFLFAFDQLTLEPSIEISPVTQHYGYMGFTITDRKGKVQIPYATMVTPAVTGDLFECDSYRSDKRRDYYRELGIGSAQINDFDNYIRNSMVIGPGETRVFRAIVYLPIMYERDDRTGSGNLSYRDLKADDEFQLFYYCKAAALRSSLPKYIREDLAKNEIEIFDGKLEASPVKLKKK